VASRSVITDNNLVTSGQTVRNLPVVCGAGAGTCTRSVPKTKTLPTHQYAVTASWWRARNRIQPNTRAARTRRRSYRRRSYREHKPTTGRVFSSNTVTPGVSFAAELRGGASQEERFMPRHLPEAVTPAARKSSVPAPVQQQKKGQSVQASHVSSQTFDNMLKVVTVVHQIRTEVSCAQSQEDQIVAITYIVLKLMNQNGH
jgi:hypothetical protein